MLFAEWVALAPAWSGPLRRGVGGMRKKPNRIVELPGGPPATLDLVRAEGRRELSAWSHS